MARESRIFRKTTSFNSEMLQLLSCVGCHQVPDDKLYILGNCIHKYCHDCLRSLARDKCVVCKELSFFKDARVDRLLTNLLVELKKIGKILEDKNERNHSNLSSGSSSNVDDVDAIAVKQSVRTYSKKSSPAEGSRLINHDIDRRFQQLRSRVEQCTEMQPPCLSQYSPSKLEESKDIPLCYSVSAEESCQHSSSPPMLTPHSPSLRSSLNNSKANIKKNSLKSSSNSKQHHCLKKVKSQIPIIKKKQKKKNSIVSSVSKHGKDSASRSAAVEESGNKHSILLQSSSETKNRCSETAPTETSVRKKKTYETIEKTNSAGETQLFVACRLGQLSKVKELIRAGADVNAQDHAGWAPLHEAINGRAQDKFSIIKSLCEAGCKVNMAGMNNETPLHEAAILGDIRIVKLLLKHKASSHIRNSDGKLPGDVSRNEDVKKLLIRSSFNKLVTNILSPSKEMTTKSRASRLRRDAEVLDPAVLENQLKNAVLYFSFDPDQTMMKEVEEKLKLKISPYFNNTVTHIIFKDITGSLVGPFNFDFLNGLVAGLWLLSSQWIEDSISKGSCEIPHSYELLHCTYSPVNNAVSPLIKGAPKRSRINREHGNPKLLDGISFFIFKNSKHTFDETELSKKDLAKLITQGDGTVINREPNPETVDPLQSPVRFHAQGSNHPLILTSHVILYDEKNEPSDKYTLEHVKSLKTSWLIDSILSFNITSPVNDYFS